MEPAAKHASASRPVGVALPLLLPCVLGGPKARVRAAARGWQLCGAGEHLHRSPPHVLRCVVHEEAVGAAHKVVVALRIARLQRDVCKLVVVAHGQCSV